MKQRNNRTTRQRKNGKTDHKVATPKDKIKKNRAMSKGVSTLFAMVAGAVSNVTGPGRLPTRSARSLRTKEEVAVLMAKAKAKRFRKQHKRILTEIYKNVNYHGV